MPFLSRIICYNSVHIWRLCCSSPTKEDKATVAATVTAEHGTSTTLEEKEQEEKEEKKKEEMEEQEEEQEEKGEWQEKEEQQEKQENVKNEEEVEAEAAGLSLWC